MLKPSCFLLIILCFSDVFTQYTSTVSPVQCHDPRLTWLSRYTSQHTNDQKIQPPQIYYTSPENDQTSSQICSCTNNLHTRKIVTLIGYDEQIYHIMKDIQVYNNKNEIIVEFYLYQYGALHFFAHLPTSIVIFEKILKKYQHYFCVNEDNVQKFLTAYNGWCVSDSICIPSKKESIMLQYLVDRYGNNILNEYINNELRNDNNLLLKSDQENNKYETIFGHLKDGANNAKYYEIDVPSDKNLIVPAININLRSYKEDYRPGYGQFDSKNSAGQANRIHSNNWYESRRRNILQGPIGNDNLCGGLDKFTNRNTNFNNRIRTNTENINYNPFNTEIIRTNGFSNKDFFLNQAATRTSQGLQSYYHLSKLANYIIPPRICNLYKPLLKSYRFDENIKIWLDDISKANGVVKTKFNVKDLAYSQPFIYPMSNPYFNNYVIDNNPNNLNANLLSNKDNYVGKISDYNTKSYNFNGIKGHYTNPNKIPYDNLFYRKPCFDESVPGLTKNFNAYDAYVNPGIRQTSFSAINNVNHNNNDVNLSRDMLTTGLGPQFNPFPRSVNTNVNNNWPYNYHFKPVNYKGPNLNFYLDTENIYPPKTQSSNLKLSALRDIQNDFDRIFQNSQYRYNRKNEYSKSQEPISTSETCIMQKYGYTKPCHWYNKYLYKNPAFNFNVNGYNWINTSPNNIQNKLYEFNSHKLSYPSGNLQIRLNNILPTLRRTVIDNKYSDPKLPNGIYYQSYQNNNHFNSFPWQDYNGQNIIVPSIAPSEYIRLYSSGRATQPCMQYSSNNIKKDMLQNIQNQISQNKYDSRINQNICGTDLGISPLMQSSYYNMPNRSPQTFAQKKFNIPDNLNIPQYVDNGNELSNKGQNYYKPASTSSPTNQQINYKNMYTLNSTPQPLAQYEPKPNKYTFNPNTISGLTLNMQSNFPERSPTESVSQQILLQYPYTNQIIPNLKSSVWPRPYGANNFNNVKDISQKLQFKAITKPASFVASITPNTGHIYTSKIQVNNIPSLKTVIGEKIYENSPNELSPDYFQHSNNLESSPKVTEKYTQRALSNIDLGTSSPYSEENHSSPAAADIYRGLDAEDLQTFPNNYNYNNFGNYPSSQQQWPKKFNNLPIDTNINIPFSAQSTAQNYLQFSNIPNTQMLDDNNLNNLHINAYNYYSQTKTPSVDFSTPQQYLPSNYQPNPIYPIASYTSNPPIPGGSPVENIYTKPLTQFDGRNHFKPPGGVLYCPEKQIEINYTPNKNNPWPSYSNQMSKSPQNVGLYNNYMVSKENTNLLNTDNVCNIPLITPNYNLRQSANTPLLRPENFSAKRIWFPQKNQINNPNIADTFDQLSQSVSPYTLPRTSIPISSTKAHIPQITPLSVKNYWNRPNNVASIPYVQTDAANHIPYNSRRYSYHENNMPYSLNTDKNYYKDIPTYTKSDQFIDSTKQFSNEISQNTIGLQRHNYVQVKDMYNIYNDVKSQVNNQKTSPYYFEFRPTKWTGTPLAINIKPLFNSNAARNTIPFSNIPHSPNRRPYYNNIYSTKPYTNTPNRMSPNLNTLSNRSFTSQSQPRQDSPNLIHPSSPGLNLNTEYPRLSKDSLSLPISYSSQSPYAINQSPFYNVYNRQSTPKTSSNAPNENSDINTLPMYTPQTKLNKNFNDLSSSSVPPKFENLNTVYPGSFSVTLPSPTSYSFEIPSSQPTQSRYSPNYDTCSASDFDSFVSHLPKITSNYPQSFLVISPELQPTAYFLDLSQSSPKFANLNTFKLQSSETTWPRYTIHKFNYPMAITPKSRPRTNFSNLMKSNSLPRILNINTGIYKLSNTWPFSFSYSPQTSQNIPGSSFVKSENIPRVSNPLFYNIRPSANTWSHPVLDLSQKPIDLSEISKSYLSPGLLSLNMNDKPYTTLQSSVNSLSDQQPPTDSLDSAETYTCPRLTSLNLVKSESSTPNLPYSIPQNSPYSQPTQPLSHSTDYAKYPSSRVPNTNFIKTKSLSTNWPYSSSYASQYPSVTTLKLQPSSELGISNISPNTLSLGTVKPSSFVTRPYQTPDRVGFSVIRPYIQSNLHFSNPTYSSSPGFLSYVSGSSYTPYKPQESSVISQTQHWPASKEQNKWLRPPASPLNNFSDFPIISRPNNVNFNPYIANRPHSNSFSSKYPQPRPQFSGPDKFTISTGTVTTNAGNLEFPIHWHNPIFNPKYHQTIPYKACFAISPAFASPNTINFESPAITRAQPNLSNSQHLNLADFAQPTRGDSSHNTLQSKTLRSTWPYSALYRPKYSSHVVTIASSNLPGFVQPYAPSRPTSLNLVKSSSEPICPYSPSYSPKYPSTVTGKSQPCLYFFAQHSPGYYRNLGSSSEAWPYLTSDSPQTPSTYTPQIQSGNYFNDLSKSDSYPGFINLIRKPGLPAIRPYSTSHNPLKASTQIGAEISDTAKVYTSPGYYSQNTITPQLPTTTWPYNTLKISKYSLNVAPITSKYLSGFVQPHTPSRPTSLNLVKSSSVPICPYSPSYSPKYPSPVPGKSQPSSYSIAQFSPGFNRNLGSSTETGSYLTLYNPQTSPPTLTSQIQPSSYFKDFCKSESYSGLPAIRPYTNSYRPHKANTELRAEISDYAKIYISPEYYCQNTIAPQSPTNTGPYNSLKKSKYSLNVGPIASPYLSGFVQPYTPSRPTSLNLVKSSSESICPYSPSYDPKYPSTVTGKSRPCSYFFAQLSPGYYRNLGSSPEAWPYLTSDSPQTPSTYTPQIQPSNNFNDLSKSSSYPGFINLIRKPGLPAIKPYSTSHNLLKGSTQIGAEISDTAKIYTSPGYYRQNTITPQLPTTTWPYNSLKQSKYSSNVGPIASPYLSGFVQQYTPSRPTSLNLVKSSSAPICPYSPSYSPKYPSTVTGKSQPCSYFFAQLSPGYYRNLGSSSKAWPYSTSDSPQTPSTYTPQIQPSNNFNDLSKSSSYPGFINLIRKHGLPAIRPYSTSYKPLKASTQIGAEISDTAKIFTSPGYYRQNAITPQLPTTTWPCNTLPRSKYSSNVSPIASPYLSGYVQPYTPWRSSSVSYRPLSSSYSPKYSLTVAGKSQPNSYFFAQLSPGYYRNLQSSSEAWPYLTSQTPSTLTSQIQPSNHFNNLPKSGSYPGFTNLIRKHGLPAIRPYSTSYNPLKARTRIGAEISDTSKVYTSPGYYRQNAVTRQLPTTTWPCNSLQKSKHFPNVGPIASPYLSDFVQPYTPSRPTSFNLVKSSSVSYRPFSSSYSPNYSSTVAGKSQPSSYSFAQLSSGKNRNLESSSETGSYLTSYNPQTFPTLTSQIQPSYYYKDLSKSDSYSGLPAIRPYSTSYNPLKASIQIGAKISDTAKIYTSPGYYCQNTITPQLPTTTWPCNTLPRSKYSSNVSPIANPYLSGLVQPYTPWRSSSVSYRPFSSSYSPKYSSTVAGKSQPSSYFFAQLSPGYYRNLGSSPEAWPYLTSDSPQTPSTYNPQIQPSNYFNDLSKSGSYPGFINLIRKPGLPAIRPYSTSYNPLKASPQIGAEISDTAKIYTSPGYYRQNAITPQLPTTTWPCNILPRSKYSSNVSPIANPYLSGFVQPYTPWRSSSVSYRPFSSSYSPKYSSTVAGKSQPRSCSFAQLSSGKNRNLGSSSETGSYLTSYNPQTSPTLTSQIKPSYYYKDLSKSDSYPGLPAIRPYSTSYNPLKASIQIGAEISDTAKIYTSPGYYRQNAITPQLPTTTWPCNTLPRSKYSSNVSSIANPYLSGFVQPYTPWRSSSVTYRPFSSSYSPKSSSTVSGKSQPSSYSFAQLSSGSNRNLGLSSEAWPYLTSNTPQTCPTSASQIQPSSYFKDFSKSGSAPGFTNLIREPRIPAIRPYSTSYNPLKASFQIGAEISDSAKIYTSPGYYRLNTITPHLPTTIWPYNSIKNKKYSSNVTPIVSPYLSGFVQSHTSSRPTSLNLVKSSSIPICPYSPSYSTKYPTTVAGKSHPSSYSTAQFSTGFNRNFGSSSEAWPYLTSDSPQTPSTLTSPIQPRNYFKDFPKSDSYPGLLAIRPYSTAYNPLKANIELGAEISDLAKINTSPGYYCPYAITPELPTTTWPQNTLQSSKYSSNVAPIDGPYSSGFVQPYTPSRSSSVSYRPYLLSYSPKYPSTVGGISFAQLSPGLNRNLGLSSEAWPYLTSDSPQTFPTSASQIQPGSYSGFTNLINKAGKSQPSSYFFAQLSPGYYRNLGSSSKAWPYLTSDSPQTPSTYTPQIQPSNYFNNLSKSGSYPGFTNLIRKPGLPAIRPYLTSYNPLKANTPLGTENSDFRKLYNSPGYYIQNAITPQLSPSTWPYNSPKSSLRKDISSPLITNNYHRTSNNYNHPKRIPSLYTFNNNYKANLSPITISGPYKVTNQKSYLQYPVKYDKHSKNNNLPINHYTKPFDEFSIDQSESFSLKPNNYYNPQNQHYISPAAFRTNNIYPIIFSNAVQGTGTLNLSPYALQINQFDNYKYPNNNQEFRDPLSLKSGISPEIRNNILTPNLNDKYKSNTLTGNQFNYGLTSTSNYISNNNNLQKLDDRISFKPFGILKAQESNAKFYPKQINLNNNIYATTDNTDLTLKTNDYSAFYKAPHITRTFPTSKYFQQPRPSEFDKIASRPSIWNLQAFKTQSTIPPPFNYADKNNVPHYTSSSKAKTPFNINNKVFYKPTSFKAKNNNNGFNTIYQTQIYIQKYPKTGDHDTENTSTINWNKLTNMEEISNYKGIPNIVQTPYKLNSYVSTSTINTTPYNYYRHNYPDETSLNSGQVGSKLLMTTFRQNETPQSPYSRSEYSNQYTGDCRHQITPQALQFSSSSGVSYNYPTSTPILGQTQDANYRLYQNYYANNNNLLWPRLNYYHPCYISNPSVAQTNKPQTFNKDSQINTNDLYNIGFLNNMKSVVGSKLDPTLLQNHGFTYAYPTNTYSASNTNGNANNANLRSCTNPYPARATYSIAKGTSSITSFPCSVSSSPSTSLNSAPLTTFNTGSQNLYSTNYGDQTCSLYPSNWQCYKSDFKFPNNIPNYGINYAIQNGYVHSNFVNKNIPHIDNNIEPNNDVNAEKFAIIQLLKSYLHNGLNSNYNEIAKNLLRDKQGNINIGNICLVQYPENCNKNTLFVRTNNPQIYMKAWKSRIKIIKANIVLDECEYDVTNFIPVIKESNRFKVKDCEAQNIVKDIVTQTYGEPIVLKGVYKIYTPYAIVCNINNEKLNSGVSNIVWPTFDESII